MSEQSEATPEKFLHAHGPDALPVAAHLRPAVLRWAWFIEHKLRARDEKYPAWESQDLDELCEKLAEGRAEVEAELNLRQWEYDKTQVYDEEAVLAPVIDELLDEAVMALIVRDRFEGWNPEMFERGRIKSG